VGALFLAGLLPGLLIGGILMVFNYVISLRRGYKGSERRSLGEIWKGFRGAILPLFTPLIIVGGIYGGIFTPTESAVVAVIYALILGGVIYREIHLKDLPEILISTACTSSVALLILAMASTFGLVSTLEDLPGRIGNLIISMAPNGFVFLVFVIIFLFVVGCFMSEVAAMIIMIPIFLPALTAFHIHPVHFGVLMMLNIASGMMTPPYGVNIFVTCSIARISIEEYAREVWPFLLALIISLLLITYFPGISLFLPNLLMR
jgi:C4-dicarboxylate transporter DctM subunit